jgi:WD40 repeat protein
MRTSNVFCMFLSSIVLCSLACSKSPPAEPTEPAKLDKPNKLKTKTPNKPALSPKLPDGALAGWGADHRQHGDGVHHIAFAPNSARVASFGGDDTLRIWDSQSGQQTDLFKLPDKQGGSDLLEFLDDDLLLLTRMNIGLSTWKIGEPYVQELAKPANAELLKCNFPEFSLAAQKRTIAFICKAHPAKAQVQIWDLKKGVRLSTVEPTFKNLSWKPPADARGKKFIEVEEIALSPDGTRLLGACSVGTASGNSATSYTHALVVWETATGSVVWSRIVKDYLQMNTTSLEFHPNGDSVGVFDFSAWWFDAKTGKPLGKLDPTPLETEHGCGKGYDAFDQATFINQGKNLVSLGERCLTVWDLEKGKPLLVRQFDPPFTGHHLAASPIGLGAAVAGQNVVKLFGGKQYKSKKAGLGHLQAIYELLFLKDGRIVASVDSESLKVWEADTGSLLGAYETYYGFPLVPAADRLTFITPGKEHATAAIRNAADGSVMKVIKLQDAYRAGVWPAKQDLTYLTQHQDDDGLTIWSGKRKVKFIDNDDYRCDMKLSEDLSKAYCGGIDSWRAWDVSSGKRIAGGPNDSAEEATALSNSGGWLAFCDEMAVRLVPLGSGKQASIPLEACQPTALSFSADEANLAVGCKDGKVLLVDIAKRSILRQLRGHKTRVVALAFSARADRLVSAGSDGRTYVWKIGSD